MTIQQIVEILENNYQKIDVFQHIEEWQEFQGVDGYSLSSIQNQFHNLLIQARVKLSDPNEFVYEESVVEEIYISYTEDENNKIQQAYKLTEESGKQLYYINLRLIDFDMGWV